MNDTGESMPVACIMVDVPCIKNLKSCWKRVIGSSKIVKVVCILPS